MQRMQRRNRAPLSWRLKILAMPGLLGITLMANFVFGLRTARAVPTPLVSEQPQSFPASLAIRDAKSTTPNRKLRLHNLCSQTVDLVIRYQSPTGKWITQRSRSLPGKHSRDFISTSSPQALRLSNKLLYYYATSPDSDLVWSGYGRNQHVFEQQILDMRIHYSSVDVLGDYSLFILCA